MSFVSPGTPSLHPRAESGLSTASSPSHVLLDSPSPALWTCKPGSGAQGHDPSPVSPSCLTHILLPTASLTFLMRIYGDDISTTYRVTSNLHPSEVLPALPLVSPALSPLTPSALSFYCPNTSHPPEQVSKPLEAGCSLFKKAVPCWYAWRPLSIPTSSDPFLNPQPLSLRASFF